MIDELLKAMADSGVQELTLMRDGRVGLTMEGGYRTFMSASAARDGMQGGPTRRLLSTKAKCEKEIAELRQKLERFTNTMRDWQYLLNQVEAELNK